ncbi:MAG: nicotianamine synthase family protein [Actinomycetota bacterium]
MRRTPSVSYATPEAAALGLLAEILGPPLDGDESSIHGTLAGLLDKAMAGDGGALAPSPVVNTTLGRLVELATTTAHDWVRSSDDCVGFHAAVVGRVGATLAADPELARRAELVRRAAAVAEVAMESHFATVIIDRAVAALAQPDDGPVASDPKGRLARILEPFPYVDNYELLVGAELAAVERRPERIVFCGAGPLPLTGLLWHLETGARVRLVELDPALAERAQVLVDVLGRLGIVDPGAFEVGVGDAVDARIDDADLVVVASLIGNETVRAVVARSADRSRAPAAVGQRVLVRSARGLVAHFVYECVALSGLAGLGLSHVGTIAPAGAVLPGSTGGTGGAVADGCGLLADGDPRLLGVADAQVLNTAEVFAVDSNPDRRRG